MAKVGIFETPPRKRFQFDSDTVVELEFISKERMGKIVQKADAAAKKMQSPQAAIFDIFLGKAAVHGWWHTDQEKNPGHPGLLLPDGSQLSFNEGNRNLLMKGCAEFSTFVFRTCTDSSKFLDDAPDAAAEPTLDELLDEFEIEEDAGKNG